MKTSRSGGLCRRIDREKKVKGRKQHIITDTRGLLLGVVVHAANIHDSQSAMDVISRLKDRCGQLLKYLPMADVVAN